MEKMSNMEVAGLIGLSHVQVSRIRSAKRQPGVETMMTIAEVFGWNMDEQAAARKSRTYASKFETALGRYAASRDTTAGSEERAPTPQ